MTSKVRNCATLAYEVINDYVHFGLYNALEKCLFGESRKSTRTRMIDDICLNNITLDPPIQDVPEILCQHFRNCIHTYAFLCMNTYQNWFPSASYVN